MKCKYLRNKNDKFDRSITRGKLLGNNAPLFIFISILIMTQLISFLRFLLTAVRTGRLGLLPIKIYRGNNAVFVSVDFKRGKESSHIRIIDNCEKICHVSFIFQYHLNESNRLLDFETCLMHYRISVGLLMWRSVMGIKLFCSCHISCVYFELFSVFHYMYRLQVHTFVKSWNLYL